MSFLQAVMNKFNFTRPLSDKRNDIFNVLSCLDASPEQFDNNLTAEDAAIIIKDI
jgi:hypothetical protein